MNEKENNENGRNKQYVDLHMHTFYSDGTDDPRSLVRASKMKGIDVMAITDHDIMSAYFEAIKEAEKWNIKLIPGVEISTEKYHILGLNVEPYNLGFQIFLGNIRQNQRELCDQRIEVLSDYGVPISYEKLEKHFPDSRLGKWNVFMTMVRDPECSEYLRTKHNGESYEELFGYYIKNIAGKVPGVPEVASRDAIEQIHNVGGIAVIAHPFKEVRNIEKELGKLRSEGIDGLEIQPNYGDKNIPFREYAMQHGMIMTYGSDWHGPTFPRPLLGKGENYVENLDEILRKHQIRDIMEVIRDWGKVPLSEAEKSIM